MPLTDFLLSYQEIIPFSLEQHRESFLSQYQIYYIQITPLFSTPTPDS